VSARGNEPEEAGYSSLLSVIYTSWKEERRMMFAYNKKEMFVYHHPKDVVLGDCCDGELEREREKRRDESGVTQ
jgi:hypothetical protein